MATKSTRSTRRNKTTGATTARPKPYAEFPLYWHKTNRWAKKVRGRTIMFGSTTSDDPDDPDGSRAALNAWLKYQDELHAGREPQLKKKREGISVDDACQKYLAAKADRRDSGEISDRTFRDQFLTCRRVCNEFGHDTLVIELRPEHFASLRRKLGKKRGPVGIGNEVGRVRAIFNWARKAKVIDREPDWGDFEKPSRKAVRRAKANRGGGPKLFNADEVNRILYACDWPLRAMVLLALNGGLGNSDVANLPQSAIDGEWLEFPRVKTAIDRRIPLWAETRYALERAIAERPKPSSNADANMCFLTELGNRWVRLIPHKEDEDTMMPLDALSQKFSKLLKKLGINGRHGIGFYTFRHCFQTYGEDCGDIVAVKAIMGHSDNSMSGVYRERIKDERLRRPVDAVMEWWCAPVEEGEATAE